MSFLESIQHGLEKASQEAARITKIQHLHNVATDLNFKASQEGQALVTKAMQMYSQGILAQGELTAICQQIATYQQQINEVHEELQRLQNDAPDAEQQIPPPPQPPLAYTPGAVPPGYPPYPAPPPVGYPAYPAPPPQAGYAYPTPAAYPVSPASPSGEPPTRPGAPVQEDEPPTQPLSYPAENPAEPAATAQAEQPAAAPHKPRQHHTHAAPATDGQAALAESAPPAAPAESAAPASPTAGTYANGALPPVFSPFTANPTGTPTASAAPAEPEPEKPAKAHHKKASATEPEKPA